VKKSVHEWNQGPVEIVGGGVGVCRSGHGSIEIGIYDPADKAFTVAVIGEGQLQQALARLDGEGTP